MMRQVQFSFLALLLIFSFTACTPSAPIKQSIKIGEFGSLSGSEATFGQGVHKGILLAIDNQNKRGGINGKKLELITKDEQGNNQLVAKVVNELIDDDQVLALIGEVASHRSLLAAPIAQSKQIPMISPSSTNPKVTMVGDYIFRVCFVDAFQGQVMAKFAYNHLKIRKVAVLKDEKSEYSMDLANFFTLTFEKLGGKIVADQTYSSGDIDFKDQLVHIRPSKPEALFLPGYYSEVGLIARQARQLGIKIPLLGGDGWDSKKLFSIGREAIKGSFYSNHFSEHNMTESVQAFVKMFRERFGNAPDGPAAGGYDAALLLIDALKRMKTFDRASLKQALENTKSFHGVTGTTLMNEHRNASKPAVILRVDGLTNRYITTIHP